MCFVVSLRQQAALCKVQNVTAANFVTLLLMFFVCNSCILSIGCRINMFLCCGYMWNKIILKSFETILVF